MQGEIVVLGGAFFINGNVNPAGEWNPLYCCCTASPLTMSVDQIKHVATEAALWCVKAAEANMFGGAPP